MGVKELGVMPKRAPDVGDCVDIWEHYRTPKQVRRHCQAVCRQATDPQAALAAHEKRWKQAKEIEEIILCRLMGGGT